jgi:hypothetical protein
MLYEYPVRVQYLHTRGGVTVSSTDDTYLKYITIAESVSSVDSGKFVPGVYRVNPYSIVGGEPNLTDQSFSVKYERLSRGVVYHYSCEVDGAILCDAINYAKNATPIPDSASYVQLVLQKAQAKVMNADLALGETLGEYKETVNMLRSPLKSLRKFLLDDRSRNWWLLVALWRKDRKTVNRLLGRTGKASAESMSSTWLEMRYGLRPLIMLLQDVIDKVNKKRQSVWDPDKIRRAKSSMVFYRTKTYDREYAVSAVQIRCKLIVEDTYRVYASVQYRQEKAQSFLDQLGLTPRFLPETIWELSRLSFVVDWIFSIGPWLGTLRWNPNCRILGHTTGVRHTRKISAVNIRVRYYYTPASWTSIKGSSSVTYNTYHRKVDISDETSPHFTWLRTIDLFKAVDLLSLIWQFLPKKRKKK